MIDTTSVSIPDTQGNSMKPVLTTRTSNIEYLCNTNEMQEIVTGVYLGSYSVAHCLESLVEKGIRYIICVRTQHDPHYQQSQISDPAITYLTLDIADKETENILRFFPYVNSFIDKALAKNCKVLVYGGKGNSRSATLVSAYVMQKYGLCVRDALRLVRAKRASVAPNAGFKAQLLEYEPIYKARRKVESEGSSSSYNHRSKRKLDQYIDAGEICVYNVVTFYLNIRPFRPEFFQSLLQDNNVEKVKGLFRSFTNFLG